MKDINLFCRKLKWRKYFQKKGLRDCHDKGLEEEDLIGLQNLVSLALESERNEGEGKLKHFNLTEAETQALNELKADPGIVIKQSDKGGNVVIMDVAAYKEMCLDILLNEDCYKKMKKSPVINFKEELKMILGDALEK